MATLAQEKLLLRKVRTFLSSSPSVKIPEGLQLIEDRLYMPVNSPRKSGIDGFLMVTLNRVATVYDTSGDRRRNFQAREADIDAMLKLLSN